MAAPIITSKYDAICADETCGAFLPAGSRIRYYRNRKVYGVDCHTKMESIQGKHSRERFPERFPVERFNTPCGCEDYPCCGHSDAYNQRVG